MIDVFMESTTALYSFRAAKRKDIYKQLLITLLRKVVCYDELRLYPWLTTNVPVEELLLESECNSPAQYVA